MANFPASLDTSVSLPNPTGTNTQNNPDHAGLHTAENAAIIAAETKLGTGASVPAANTLLVGTGAGASAWSQLTSAQLAAILSDETGSGAAVFANTPVLITPKVDTINENTVGNGVTVGGVNLKSGAISTANSVPTVALQSNAVTSDKVAPGAVVGMKTALFVAAATGTTIMPFDDTIPQITEGAEFMTITYSPQSTTNHVMVESLAWYSHDAANAQAGMALFRDAVVNALAVTEQYQNTATAVVQNSLMYDFVPGATTSITFRIRIGSQNAGTLTFNGQSGTRRYGGVATSYMKITEYKA
jgi:hypothetical protein